MEITLYILVAFCSLSSRAGTFHVNKHIRFLKSDGKKFRCGVQDGIIPQEANQYRLKGGKWEIHRLTFAIENYPDRLAKNDVINQISHAFNIWSKYTNLIFVLKNFPKKANFNIKFVKGNHGDGIPFDGPGNVLGHSFSPNAKTRRGQIHFDASEQWTIKSHKGVNLYQNAAHEIGHALGLDHSFSNSSLMSVYYQYNEMFQTELSQDDIDAIQAVYGIKEKRKKAVGRKSVWNYTRNNIKWAIFRKHGRTANKYKKYN